MGRRTVITAIFFAAAASAVLVACAALGLELVRGAIARTETAELRALELAADRAWVVWNEALAQTFAQLERGEGRIAFERGELVKPPAGQTVESLFARSALVRLTPLDPEGIRHLESALRAEASGDREGLEQAARLAADAERHPQVQLRAEHLLAAAAARAQDAGRALLHRGRARALLDAESKTSVEGLLLRADASDAELLTDLQKLMGGPLDGMARGLLGQRLAEGPAAIAEREAELALRARLLAADLRLIQGSLQAIPLGKDLLVLSPSGSGQTGLVLRADQVQATIDWAPAGDPALEAIEMRTLDPRELGLAIAVRRSRAEIDALAQEEAQSYGVLIAASLVAILAAAGFAIRSLVRERAAARRRGALLAHLGHELRTPVASLRMFAETLAAGRAQGAEALEFAEITAREARRVSEALEKALTFGRMHAAKEPPAEVDLTLLAREVQALVGPLADEQGYAIEDAAEGVCTIIGRRESLRTALLVLFENALQHGGAGQRCRWRTARLDSGAVAFEIEDAGPGFPAELGSRLFEPFVRGPGASGRGIGLGLALALDIARDHGGLAERIPSRLGGAGLRLTLRGAEPKRRTPWRAS